MLPRTQPYSFANTGDTSAGLFQDISTRSLQSVRVGESAGAINSGIGNAFIGVQAGMKCTQANYVTAIGYQASAYSSSTAYNTIIGAYSGANLSTGNELVFIGYRAGELSGNVNQNVGIGAFALRENTSGNATVAVGYRAGEKTLDGGYNTMIGALAGQDNRSGNFNTMAGYQSGRSAFLGNENTYFGAYAGYSNAFGSANTLIGTKSGELLYNGSYNIFIGYKSGQNFKFGDYNIAIGPFSLQNALSGSSNVIIGSGAGISGTSNNSSVIIGTGAGSNASISQGVVIGTDALAKDINGNSVVVIGYQAAQNLPTGASNTFIGAQTAQNLQGGDYNVTVGAYSLQNAKYALSNVIIGNSAAINSTSNIRSVVIGTSTASNANLTESIVIGTNTATNVNTSASVIIGYKSAKNLVNGNSNILIGNGADVFKPNTTNAISISSCNTLTANNSISIGTNLSNERYNSVLLGKNLVTDADQTVIIGNDINIDSIIYFKDPLNYNLKNSVLVDAIKKLNINTISYQDSLIRQDGTILNTANLGIYTTNTENSFTNPINRLNSNIVTDVLFKIPSISNVAIVPDIVVPILTTSNINNINDTIIKSFTPKNTTIPIINISNLYNTKLSVNYNFEVPKTIYNNDGISKNIITTLPIQGIWSTHIENSNANIRFNDSIVSIYNNLFICGSISSSTIPTKIYNSDGSIAYTYLADNSLINGFIIKYDENGNVIWYTITSSFGNNTYNSITVDKYENVYCTGYIGSNSSNIYNNDIQFYNSNLSSCNIIFNNTYKQYGISIKYNTYGILEWANIINTDSISKNNGRSINIYHNTNESYIYNSYILNNNNTLLQTLNIYNINKINNYSKQTIFTKDVSSYSTTILTSLFQFNTSNGYLVNNNYVLYTNTIDQPSNSSTSILNINSVIYSISITNNANGINIIYPQDINTFNTISLPSDKGIVITSYTSNLLYNWYTSIYHSTFNNNIIAYISKDTYDNNFVVVGNYFDTIVFYNSDNSIYKTLQNQNNNQNVYIVKYNSIGNCIWVSYISATNVSINDLHISLYDSIYIGGTYNTNSNIQEYKVSVYNLDNTLAPINLYNNGCYLIEYNKDGFAHFGTNVSKNGVDSINLCIFSTYIYISGSYSSQFIIYDPDGLLNNTYYLGTNSNYPNLFINKYSIVNNSLQYILPSITTSYIYQNHTLPYLVDFHLQYENILQNNSTSNSLLLPIITSNEPWSMSFWYKQLDYTSNDSIIFVSPNLNILYINSSGILFSSNYNQSTKNNILLPHSNVSYKLYLNNWYNFTFTGGILNNINNLYINGIYTYQFNNDLLINDYLFHNSNEYNTSLGNCQNIIAWNRTLTYNEIYSLYLNGKNYIPTINDALYSNISFIFDLTNFNTNSNSINSLNSNIEAVFIGNSNSYTIDTINNLPVLNLRNFNLSNTQLLFEFPKRITPLQSIGECNINLYLNDKVTLIQSVSLTSNLFKYTIDTSGTINNISNGIYIPSQNIQYIVTTLPQYGTLSQYVFNTTDTITYSLDLENSLIRNDKIVLTAVSYIYDSLSNVYGLPSTSNYTINFNISTTKILSTDTIILQNNQERIINLNDIIVVQDTNKSYIQDDYIFNIDNNIGSNLIIGYSNNINLIYNNLINTITSNISGVSNITSNIIIYTQSHTKYYDNSNNYLYTIDSPLTQLSVPILSNVIYTYSSNPSDIKNYYINNLNIDDKLYYNISSISKIPLITYRNIKDSKISIKSTANILNTQNLKFNIYTNRYDQYNNLVPVIAYFDTNSNAVPISTTFQILNANNTTNYKTLDISQLKQTYNLSMNNTNSFIYLSSNIIYSRIYIYTYPKYGYLSLSNIINTNNNLNTIYYYPANIQFSNDLIEFIIYNDLNESSKISCYINPIYNSFRIQPIYINTLSYNCNIYYESNVYSNILTEPINGLSNITSNIIIQSIEKNNYYDIRFNEYIYSSLINSNSNYIITITSNAIIDNTTAYNIVNYNTLYYGSNIYRTYQKISTYNLYNSTSNIQYTNITSPTIYNNGFNIIKKNVGFVNQWLQNDINNNYIYIYWSNIDYDSNLEYTYNLQYTFSALSTFINFNIFINNQFSNIVSPIIYKNTKLQYSSITNRFISLSNIFINDYNSLITSNIITSSNDIKYIRICSTNNGFITKEILEPFSYITSIDYSNINMNGYYSVNPTTISDIFQYFYVFKNNLCSAMYINNLYIEQIPLSYGQSFINGLTQKTNTLSQYNFIYSFKDFLPNEITINIINIPNGITIYNKNTNTIINTLNTFTLLDIINNYILINFNTNSITYDTIYLINYNIKLGDIVLSNYSFPILLYKFNDFIDNKFINNNTNIIINFIIMKIIHNFIYFFIIFICKIFIF